MNDNVIFIIVFYFCQEKYKKRQKALDKFLIKEYIMQCRC